MATAWAVSGPKPTIYAPTPRYAELHRNILDVFNENGVQIMTPAYALDPSDAKIVPKEEWHKTPA